ncbi:MAG: nucleotidyltransferase domain-containing protein [Planctomycetota bacterium]
MIQKAGEATPQVAAAYAREVRRRLASHVRRIILFGSHARGDASDASDYDFVVVVDRPDRSLRDAVSAAGARVLDTENALCAALVYGPEQWERVKQSPLGWNVEREGIEL